VKVLPTSYETALMVYEEEKEKRGRSIIYVVSVKLPSYRHKLYLVVIKWFGKEPMVLSTSGLVGKTVRYP
jgi:hypothetical protein